MSMEQTINWFMEETVSILVTRLSDLKHELSEQMEQAQDIFRDYVVSKQYPIDDRFEVWVEWCEKENHSWVINEVDVPFIGKIVWDDEVNFEFYLHEKYDWLYFLELFDDIQGAEMRERYKVTLDDVKELLIETNFGSYIHDW